MNRVKHYAKEIVLFFIVMTIFMNILSLYKSTDLNKKPLNLPNITLTHNKPVLIHFWATWCPTCKVEASNIQTISEYYDVVTIAVKSGSNQEIQKYLDENNYTFRVVNDSTGAISSNFKIGVFPTTFIYDKDKNMVFSEVGYTSTWGLALRMWWSSL